VNSTEKPWMGLRCNPRHKPSTTTFARNSSERIFINAPMSAATGMAAADGFIAYSPGTTSSSFATTASGTTPSASAR
jgi:hypothetical protein